jgi:hypothetical protein
LLRTKDSLSTGSRSIASQNSSSISDSMTSFQLEIPYLK